MKNIGITILFALLMISVWSCNEKNWLKEEPLSFYTTSNSYTTAAQFRNALNFEYDNLRRTYWEIGDPYAFLAYGDLAFGGTDYPDLKFNNAKTWLVSNAYYVDTYWQKAYVAIGNTNTIINRVKISSITSQAKATVEGEALFFRAYWYNFLANMYGGVPITLEEATSPRKDFRTSSRDSVYNQARIDLERAVSLLTNIDSVDDGKVSKQAAQHLLSEVYINVKDYSKAITAASAVINYPKMKLMTTRFGSRASETGSPYWDLFQLGNQNRKTSANTESLLVLQYDYKNSGSSVSHQGPRNILPFYAGILVKNKIVGQADVAPFVDFSEDKGGRGIGVIHPTSYFCDSIWGTDGTNDNRNAPYLIVRDFKIDNVNAAGYDKWYIADGYFDKAKYGIRNFYPFIMKFSQTGNLPDEQYLKNADGSYKKNGLGQKLLAYVFGGLVANSSLKDEYLFRLGGTYLLRAEAYIKNNQPDLALTDINALRTRANATPATLGQINLDYLMDEQLRELYFEDFRYVTLARMNKLVERMRKHNPMGYNVMDYNGLYPIPFSEIERNVNGNITQNSGYN